MEMKKARHPKYPWLLCYEDGRIWSERGRKGKGEWVKGHLRPDGHLQTFIFENRKWIASPLMHSLIYEAFNGEYNHKTHDVHHLNGNGADNRLENMVLLTKSEHSSLHSNTKENRERISELGKKNCKKATEASKKPVCQFSKDGKFLKEWESAAEASRQTGVNFSHISECCSCKPRHRTTGGYIWKYKDN